MRLTGLERRLWVTVGWMLALAVALHLAYCVPLFALTFGLWLLMGWVIGVGR